MQLSDRITGAVLVSLGAAAAWGGSRLPPVPGQDVGPAAFPMVIGFGLVACGVLIALGIGRGFEVPEEEGPAQTWFSSLRVLVPPLLLFFYALTSEALGFLLTAAVMVFIAAIALGARPGPSAVLALAAPPLVHLAFYKLLSVPLPAGILPAPW